MDENKKVTSTSTGDRNKKPEPRCKNIVFDLELTLKGFIVIVLGILFIGFFMGFFSRLSKCHDNVGGNGQLCYPNNTCDRGFLCNNSTCVHDERK